MVDLWFVKWNFPFSLKELWRSFRGEYILPECYVELFGIQFFRFLGHKRMLMFFIIGKKRIFLTKHDFE